MQGGKNQFDWRGFVVPVLLIASLEIVAIITDFKSYSLARPSEILMAFFQAVADGTLPVATLQTLTSALGGLLIGTTIGLLLGVVFGLFPAAWYLSEFTIEALRPMPSVALITVVMLIAGFGYAMEIPLVAKATTWPVLFLTHAAVAGVNQRLIEVTRLLGLGFWAGIYKVVLPAALPGIIVGIRLSAGVSIIVAITIEIAANPIGLGHAMMQSQAALRPALTLALVVWTGVLGWCLNALMLKVEDSITKHYRTAAVQ